MAAPDTAGPAENGSDPVPRRSPWGPCLLAWVFPGAGHVLLGRVGPGLVFAGVILACFLTGLMLNGTVYSFDSEQPLSYLATAANLGVGPLDVWARLQTHGSLRFRVPDSRVDPVMRERVLKRVRQSYVSQTHAYGRTFLLTAGLMNLLLLLDVYDYCIGRKPQAPVAVPAGAEVGEG